MIIRVLIPASNTALIISAIFKIINCGHIENSIYIYINIVNKIHRTSYFVVFIVNLFIFIKLSIHHFYCMTSFNNAALCLFNSSALNLIPITFAGLPATILPSGTSFVTIAPAPIILPNPT